MTVFSSDPPLGQAWQALLRAAYGGLSLPDWPVAQNHIERVVLPAGAEVFAQGASHAQLYVVVQGLVRLSYLDEGGSEWVKSFCAEGMFFASTSALAPSGRTTFRAVACEPLVLERLPFAVLDALAQRHLAWARALMGLALRYAQGKEAREHMLLTLNAEARYRAWLADSPELAQRVPQKDLARFLGLTPEGLNRIVRRVRLAQAGTPATGPRGKAEDRA